MEYINLKNLNTREINIISGGTMNMDTTVKFTGSAFDKAKEYIGFDATNIANQIKSYITNDAVTAAATTGAAVAVTGATYGIAHGIMGGINGLKKYLCNRETRRIAALVGRSLF